MPPGSRKAPFKLKKFPQEDTLILAAAIEQAGTQRIIDLLPPGHIAKDSRERGGLYAAWIRSREGKLFKEHLGPVNGEKHLAAEARLAELKLFQDRAKKLRKLGFASIEHDAALVLAQMHNHGIFAGGGVLVGTRAFGAILNQLGWHTTPYLSTTDVDLARMRALALATPLGEAGFIGLLKDTGLAFSPVMGLDRPPMPPTSFKVIGRDLKVDLLVPARANSKPYASVPLTELGTHATSLPFLEYLLAETTTGMVIGRDHLVPVMVPRAGRYALHKLLVADLRTGAENPKIEKDLSQAGILAAILAEEDPAELEDAAGALTPTMKKHIRRSMPKWAKMMSGEYPDAVALVAGLIG